MKVDKPLGFLLWEIPIFVFRVERANCNSSGFEAVQFPQLFKRVSVVLGAEEGT
jgi:hypothetical protein